MKIIQAVNYYYPDSSGGTERYIDGVGQELRKLGHQIIVLAPTLKKSSHYLYNGIEVFRFAVPEKTARAEYLGMCRPTGYDDFMKIVLSLKPDLMHFTTFSRAVNSFQLAAVKRLGIPVVFTSHLSNIFCPRGNLLNSRGKWCREKPFSENCFRCIVGDKYPSWLCSWWYRLAEIADRWHLARYGRIFSPYHAVKRHENELDIIRTQSDCNIALSNWILRRYRDAGILNSQLVAQGISGIFSGRAGAAKCQDILRLLFIGRIEYPKGLDILCQALQSVDPERFELTMGVLHYNDDLYRKVKRFVHLLPHFRWKEALDGEEVKEADLLVLPSRYEMSPLVIQESFGCGLPVLASDIEPNTDHVRDGVNGRLFRCGDSNDLAKKISECLDSRKLLAEFKANITPPRTFADVAGELNLLYREIVRRKMEGEYA